MDILVCTDKKYIMPACVLMCSVAENNKEEGPPPSESAEQ